MTMLDNNADQASERIGRRLVHVSRGRYRRRNFTEKTDKPSRVSPWLTLLKGGKLC